MKKKSLYGGIGLAAIAMGTLVAWDNKPATPAPQPPRPNVIIIMADDMGFSDLGCYGGEIKTPNIDYLAQHGIRYRQFYNTSRCCPTRASLLTGLLWKAESYEGGIHTPLIAHWPKGIKAKKGSYSDQLGHVMDFMATITELTGATYPTNYKGHTILPTTGRSLVPSFKGQANGGHQELFNEHFGARYARQGNWKIVSGSGKDSTWKLFDLAKDRTETVDLASQYPQKVQELEARWRQWALTHNVFPKPGKP